MWYNHAGVRRLVGQAVETSSSTSLEPGGFMDFKSAICFVLGLSIRKIMLKR